MNCQGPSSPPPAPLRRRTAKRKRVWPVRKRRYRLPMDTVRLQARGGRGEPAPLH